MSPCRISLGLLTVFQLLLFNEILAAKTVLSIGHRGNSMFAPENTLASFSSALGKADLVETDGQVTADGRLVIMHDSTVDRTTDGSGAIANFTVEQLKQFDAGYWFSPNFIGERIPTVEEYLQTVIPTATPLLEQKSGSATIYVNELSRLGFTTNVVIQSFDWNFLAQVHALEPRIRLCALGSGTLNTSVITTITNAGARILAWEKSYISSNEVSLVHSLGFNLFVWTVDGAEIKTMIDLGVDGIISDDPGMVRQLSQTNNSTLADFNNNLLAYWKLDDGLSNSLSTVVTDSKGSNHATLFRPDGQSHWSSTNAAKFGGCFSVDGTNGYALMPTNSVVDIGTNEVTISLWVNLRYLPSQSPDAYSSIFDSVDDNYVLYMDRANKELRFKVTAANGHAARPGINELSLRTNEWLHVVATYSGKAGAVSGQATIYLNGQPKDVHTGDDSGGNVGLTGNVKPGQVAAIGRNGSQNVYRFTGLVDDIALWNRALSPAEVAAVYQAGQAGQSLQTLLAPPTPPLRLSSFHFVPGTKQLQIFFHNTSPATNFYLLRAFSCDGAYERVTRFTPVSLGAGDYRIDYPFGGGVQQFFKIEGE
jgi:glycerophosphoryl diester phosphodiesterase